MARTTSDIIDQAIRENRSWELLLRIFAVVFITVGVGVIAWATMHDRPIGVLAGVVESALFLPAVNIAKRTRTANIMLRLLEVPLDKSQTAEEAAEMLQRVFESHFREDNGQPKRKRKLVGAQ